MPVEREESAQILRSVRHLESLAIPARAVLALGDVVLRGGEPAGGSVATGWDGACGGIPVLHAVASADNTAQTCAVVRLPAR
jgi:hypothetical protein